MPVNFDSSGRGSKLTVASSGTLTWSHTVSTLATNTVALVAILWNGDVDVTSATFGVTYAGTSMTKIAGPVTWLSGIGSNPKSWMAMYSLTSPPAGTSTISVSWSGMSGTLLTDNLLGVSASYSGVASVDAAVTATTTTTTNNSVTVSSTAPANRVVTVHGIGSTRGFTSSYAGSLRASSTPFLGGQLLIGDTQGSSSITETLTMASTNQWGAFGVNLEPAVVYASAAAPGITLGPTLARGGVFRSSLPPASRTWLIGVGGQYGPVDTRIGPPGPTFAGFQSVSGGTAVQGLVTNASGGTTPVGSPVTLPVGPAGPANTLSVGTVTGVAPGSAAATISGTAPSQQLNLALPRGYSIVGLTPYGDGTQVQALVESPSGPVGVGSPFTPSNSYNSTVTHGTNASYARPPVSVAVIWIGSVAPTNAITGDVWMDTSGVAPTITTTTLNALNVSVPISQTLVATGTTPLTWSVTSGSVPTGLTLSSAGVLGGTPTTTGSYSFTAQALNGFGSTTQSYSGTVGAAIAPTITTSTLGTITASVAYSLTLSASGSVPTWSVTSGSLPTGLSLNTSTGVISGTPTTTGSYSVTVTATNSAGSANQTFTGTVGGVAPTITTTTLNSMWRAFSFSQTLAYTGSGTITFAVASGSLPTGLSLNTSTGAITGTPSATGSYSFTISATNSYGSASQAFTGSVAESTPVISTSAINTLQVSTAFTQTIGLTSGGPTITWSVSAGSLPAGLTLNTSTGVISGTPTTAGAYSFTIQASNGSASGTKAFTGTVINPLAFDVVGGSGAYSVSTKSVTISPNAGDTVLLFVHNTAGSTPTATIGGTSMTQIGTTYNYGSISTYQQYMSVFSAQSVTGGSTTFTATSTGASAVSVLAVAYSTGTPTGALFKQNGTGTAVSQTASSSTGKLLVNYLVSPNNYTLTSYNQTQRYNAAPHFTMVAGDAAGAASVTFSATQGASGLWGSLAVELQ